LLPYIEQTSLYNAALLNPGDTWDQAVPSTGQPVRCTSVKSFHCPSDFTTTSAGWAQDQVGNWMASSYSGNFQMFGGTRPGGNCDASQYNIGNIPDGTSQTIGFAESYGGADNGGSGTLWAWPGNDWGNGWAPSIGNNVKYGNWNQVPQFAPTYAVATKGRSQAAHVGNVLVSLMDGSVRSISSGVTQVAWQNGLQPADGNVMDTSW
jgi:hypothetical protein